MDELPVQELGVVVRQADLRGRRMEQWKMRLQASGFDYLETRHDLAGYKALLVCGRYVTDGCTLYAGS